MKKEKTKPKPIARKRAELREAIKKSWGQEPYIPVYLGPTPRCFLCGAKDSELAILERYRLARKEIFFGVCESCTASADPAHARREYLGRLRRFRENLRSAGSHR